MNKLIFPLFCAVVGAAGAQTPIVTDRPDFTESSFVVPTGRFQIENGFTAERSRGARSFGLPETLFRIGLAQRWEARIGAPNHFTLRANGQTRRGLGDVYVGAKYQLGPLPGGFEAALIPATFLPTADAGFGAPDPEPEIKLCLAKDAFSGMIYLSWPSEGPESWQTTISYGHPIRENFGAFLEYVGNFRQERPQHLAHAGFAYRTTDDEQWDLHFGHSLSGPRARFVGFGYSIRR